MEAPFRPLVPSTSTPSFDFNGVEFGDLGEAGPATTAALVRVALVCRWRVGGPMACLSCVDGVGGCCEVWMEGVAPLLGLCR